MKNKELKPVKQKDVKAPKWGAIVSAIVVVLIIAAYLIVVAFAKVSVAATTENINVAQGSATKIAWPASGQSAVGAVGAGVAATNGDQTAHPIASIAKVFLAMAVLDKYPLAAGETGSTVTLSDKDVQYYHDDLANGGSLLPVNSGEKITEYQLLQGLLIASGDNIATTLADWAYGSVDNYLAYANEQAAKMGLTTTHMADASGLSAETTSSARDLVIAGIKAMNYPAIAEIVNQPKATLPVAGVVNNYNTILGQDGVIGIKTGNTPEAGGCLLFAFKNPTDITAPTVVGAILGGTSRIQVLKDTTTFVQANTSKFKNVEVVKAGDLIGTYETPWGQSVEAKAKENLTAFTVNNEKITPDISLQKINSSRAKNAEVGTLIVKTSSGSKSVSVVLNSSLTASTYTWKLLHPWKLSFK